MSFNRDLGIGGEAHKQIDAKVKQGGFDIVNKSFELGRLWFTCWSVCCCGSETVWQMPDGQASICNCAAGEVSFHSGWTFHQASGNETDTPREVYTIIFMDKDMLMAEPINHNQRLDHDRSAFHMYPFEFNMLRLFPLDSVHLRVLIS